MASACVPSYVRILVVIGGLLLHAQASRAMCGVILGQEDRNPPAAGAGLYSDAARVAVFRDGTRTTLSMSVDYSGPAEDFALVVPVPVILQPGQVRTLDPQLFKRLDEATAPELSEYWEQRPCEPNFHPNHRSKPLRPGDPFAEPVGLIGDGGSGNGNGHRDSEPVTIEERFVEGEYQIVILSAQDSGALVSWLRRAHYHVPSGAEEALRPYIQDSMKFFVARVDIRKVRRDAAGRVALSPLRFSYESKDLRLPVRLGMFNARGPQDLIVYALHPSQRLEAANYPNVFAPTNLELSRSARSRFAAVYGAIFDEVLQRGAGVVTEYAQEGYGCQPCFGESLTRSDLLSLGDERARPSINGNPVRGPAYVMTRLHMRMSPEQFRADLVLREAAAVWGGHFAGDGYVGEQGVRPSRSNRFRARYVIRHPYEGSVMCRYPAYGSWLDRPPEQGEPSAPPPISGRIVLSEVILSAVPALGLQGHVVPLRTGGALR